MPQRSYYHRGSTNHSIYMCSEYHSLYYTFYELKIKTNKNKMKVSEKVVGSKIGMRTGYKNANQFTHVLSKVTKKGSNLVWIPKGLKYFL